MGAPKVFISHSTQDRDLAKSLVDFLRDALAFKSGEILCTSVEGFKLSPGEKTEEGIRKAVLGADEFLGIISPHSIRSTWVLFELGARWGAEKHLVPLLAYDTEPQILPPPLSDRHALRCKSSSDLEELIRNLARALKQEIPASSLYKEALLKVTKVPEPRVKDVPSSQGRNPSGNELTGDHLQLLWVMAKTELREVEALRMGLCEKFAWDAIYFEKMVKDLVRSRLIRRRQLNWPDSREVLSLTDRGIDGVVELGFAGPNNNKAN